MVLIAFSKIQKYPHQTIQLSKKNHWNSQLKNIHQKHPLFKPLIVSQQYFAGYKLATAL